MSVNTIHHTSTGPFQLIPEESILTPAHTADIELRVPATIQGPKRTETAKGLFWVTDQRVVFKADTASSSRTAPPAYDAPPSLDSLSIPYAVLLSAVFELPIFSSNHILIKLLPDPNDPESGLPSPGRGGHLEVKVVIGEGAGHGVWKRIEGERQNAEARRKEGEMLPAYEQ